jgi:hypothetical protein
MTQRTVPFIAAALMLPIIIVSQILHFPAWVGMVGGLSTTFLVLFLFLRGLKQKRSQAIADPMLKARVETVLSQIDVEGVPVITVHGAGYPVVEMRRGHLLVSPQAGELLSDEELGAVALQALSFRPDVLRREMLRYYGPWAAVLLVAGAVSLYTGFPWIGPVFLIMVVWLQIDIRRRGFAQRIMEANVQAFLDRGGNASALLTGLVKTQSALIRSGVNQVPVVSQFRGTVETVVRMGGIDRSEAERMMAHLHAPPELGAVGQAKARRQIWGIGILVLLVVAATFIPTLLTKLLQ